jgi:hypothetical protein
MYTDKHRLLQPNIEHDGNRKYDHWLLQLAHNAWPFLSLNNLFTNSTMHAHTKRSLSNHTLSILHHKTFPCSIKQYQTQNLFDKIHENHTESKRLKAKLGLIFHKHTSVLQRSLIHLRILRNTLLMSDPKSNKIATKWHNILFVIDINSFVLVVFGVRDFTFFLLFMIECLRSLKSN